jgi:archaellum component FlaC
LDFVSDADEARRVRIFMRHLRDSGELELGREFSLAVNIAGLNSRTKSVTKWRSDVSKLETLVSSKRNRTAGSPVKDQFQGLQGSIAQEREKVAHFQQTIADLNSKIERMSLEINEIRLERSEFDAAEALKATARQCQQKFHSLKQSLSPAATREERCEIEGELEDLHDRFNDVMSTLERFRSTTEQDLLRATRRERNRLRGEVAHQTLQQAGERLAQFEEWETNALENERTLQLMGKSRGRADDGLVAKLSELTFDRLQWTEIIEVIEREVQDLAKDLVGSVSGKRWIDDLRDALVVLIRSHGAKIEQKLRIYRLTKDVERLEKQE